MGLSRCVFDLITSISAIWWMDRVILEHQSRKGLRSWKDCASIPLDMQFPHTLSMPLAAEDKFRVGPNYLLAQAPGRVVLRNFEGFVTTYQEPLDYDPAEIQDQEQLIERRSEPGQEGVSDLLEGKRMTIKPDGFDIVRSRGGEEHRLRSGDDSHKWQPLGVGSIDSEGTEPSSLPGPKKEHSSGEEAD